MRIFRYFIFISLLTFVFDLVSMRVFAQESSKKTTSAVLAAIPAEDRQALETLFRYLMSDGDFAYTLFGEKPMAFCDLYMDLELHFFLEESALDLYSNLYKGWAAWQKHKGNFSLNSFVFSDSVDRDYALFGFILYHKDRVQALFDQYPLIVTLFGHVDQLQKGLTDFYSEKSFFAANKNDFHQAIGLLLGYDEASTAMFKKNYMLKDLLITGPFSLEGLQSKEVIHILINFPDKTRALPSKNFRASHAIAELNDLSTRSKLVKLSCRNEPFRVHLIEIHLKDGVEIIVQDTRASNTPLTLFLPDTFQGFSKAAAGMTYGERRKIYMHPDAAYGKYGHRGLQQLLIYDVERLSS